MFRPTTRPIAIAAAWLAAVATADAAVIYSLAGPPGAPQSLVRFDSAAPAAVTTVGAISGATQNLDGIDFRPADGMLYGYDAATSGIFRVDLASGSTTLVGTAAPGVTTPRLGIDFNPVPDRLRVVSANDENRRINVDGGATIVDGTLQYAAGDANQGVDPTIVEAAYTRSDNDPATGTQLYYLDSVLDALVTTANPNAGLLTTVGALGVDFGDAAGFDILTDANGVDTAFARLLVGGVESLYTIDLASGVATAVGAIGAGSLRGLAAAAAAVPEPATLALLAVAAGGALVARRRRSSLPSAATA